MTRPGCVTAGNTVGACDPAHRPSPDENGPSKNHGDAWLGAERKEIKEPQVRGGGLRREGCRGAQEGDRLGGHWI